MQRTPPLNLHQTLPHHALVSSMFVMRTLDQAAPGLKMLEQRSFAA
jgi:hypothetical protein